MWMCQTCGEHFETEVPVAARELPACPSCGSRNAEWEDPSATAAKPISRFDAGICPCAVLSLSGQHKKTDQAMIAHATSRPTALPFARTAKLLRVVAFERRLRILAALLDTELCVCELADALLMAQYEVSRHLARLKRVGLVVDRREGLWAYYSIPKSAWQDPLLAEFLDLVRHERDTAGAKKGDAARLAKRLSMRTAGRCVIGVKV